MAQIRITLTAQLYGSICQNVWHLNKPDFVSSELATIVQAWRDQWMDIYRNMIIAETTFLNLKGEVITSSGAGDVVNLPLSMVGGSGNDSRSPLGMALVVQLRTGLGGRKNRGRFFVFGTSVGQSLNGLWTGSWLTTVGGYLTALSLRWVSPHATAGASLVLIGKGDDPADYRVITSMAARATPGSQRRRMLGVGI